jgi:predicted DNA binding protein
MFEVGHGDSPFMMEASLLIRLPDTWVTEVCEHSNAVIHFHRCLPYGSTGGRSLIELEGCEDAAQAIEDIRKHPAVERVEVSSTEGEKISATVVNRTCPAGQALAASDCFMVAARSLDDGRVRWRVVSGKEGSLNSLVEELRAAGCGVEVERVGGIRDESLLTKRQEEILALALKEGYYETPKRVHLSELAKRLGVAPSSLGEVLKRAERAVIEEHLGRE